MLPLVSLKRLVSLGSSSVFGILLIALLAACGAEGSGLPGAPRTSVSGARLNRFTSAIDEAPPVDSVWDVTKPMASTRYLPTATLLPSGLVLVAGGFDANGKPLSSAELYDPATRTFLPTGDMNVGRGGAAAAHLPNGQVLIVGGLSDNGPVASTELYDPAGKTFKPDAVMAAARSGATATVLQNGRVLIVGGSLGADAELYDPEIHTFFLLSLRWSGPARNIPRRS